jgi:phage shock protein PspC (stress-responsive transcriptional regulator)
MNEVTRIHLGRIAFTISVEAHKELKAYLAAIKHQVGTKHVDVIEEVEMRMAELLHERGIKDDKTVLAEDVDYLKKQLGEPRDFTDTDKPDETSEETEATQAKRLFRDPEHGIVAGVAAGLATYFGVDVTIVRLLFVALLLFGGSSIVLYLVLWLIMPEAKSQGDRLQMHGRAVTVDTLKEFVERADVDGAAKRAGGAVRKVIEGVFKLALMVVGVAFVTGALLGLASAVSFGAILFGNAEYAFNGIRIFPVGGREMLVLGLGLTAAIIPLVFALFGGLALVRRKWTFPNWAVAGMLSIFFVSLAAGLTLGANVFPKVKQRYEDAKYSLTRPLGEFNELAFVGDGVEVTYEPAATYSMEVRSVGPKDIGAIKTSITNGVLNVDTRNFTRNNNCDWFCVHTDNAEVIIRAPKLPKVTLGEDVDFTIKSRLNQDGLSLKAADTASFHLEALDVERARLTITPDHDRILDLAGITSTRFKGDGIWSDDFAVTLGNTKDFELNTKDTCDPGEPLVFLETPPQHLKINGRDVSQDDLHKGQEAYTDASCVQLLGKPAKPYLPVKESYKPSPVETL